MGPNAKRRKIEVKAVEEVTFDYAAREEYLTGFHKRKLERARHVRELAEKKARAERIEDRRKLREERKADLERHMQEVNALLRPQTESDAESDDEDEDEDEWGGFDEPPPVDHEAEYIDEDRYTTVTVEEMDVSKEGIHKAEVEAARKTGDAVEDEEEAADNDETATTEKKSGRKVWSKSKPKDGIQKPKIKKKKFRYESKAERKLTRRKERSGNSKAAKARKQK